MVNKLDSYNLIARERLLIKLDVLASEWQILLGSEETIKKQKPILIFEFGTLSDHIFDVVPWLNNLNNDYSFYLRQLKTFDNSRTILFAI